eukprot:TRINITY_DN4213_c0_g1_i1.p1 TRINITY_DN4213_c0_g1~~TRINITY_DN4213_c0_g1_i1.p1  ORF type:complete len:1222 (+),score=319.15 TRINITY_DN4213_c0_g1_i1:186-3851(+)
MEVYLREVNGAPRNAHVSLRVDRHTRRQAALDDLEEKALKKPFKFAADASKEASLRVDVLEELSSARCLLPPAEDGVYTLPLGANGEAAVAVRVSKLGTAPASEARGCSSRRQQVKSDFRSLLGLGLPDAAALLANEEEEGRGDGSGDDEGGGLRSEASRAKAYLEEHALLPFVKSMLSAVIQEQPQDPYSFVSQMFGVADSCADGCDELAAFWARGESATLGAGFDAADDQQVAGAVPCQKPERLAPGAEETIGHREAAESKEESCVVPSPASPAPHVQTSTAAELGTTPQPMMPWCHLPSTGGWMSWGCDTASRMGGALAAQALADADHSHEATSGRSLERESETASESAAMELLLADPSCLHASEISAAGGVQQVRTGVVLYAGDAEATADDAVSLPAPWLSTGEVERLLDERYPERRDRPLQEQLVDRLRSLLGDAVVYAGSGDVAGATTKQQQESPGGAKEEEEASRRSTLNTTQGSSEAASGCFTTTPEEGETDRTCEEMECGAEVSDALLGGSGAGALPGSVPDGIADSKQEAGGETDVAPNKLGDAAEKMKADDSALTLYEFDSFDISTIHGDTSVLKPGAIPDDAMCKNAAAAAAAAEDDLATDGEVEDVEPGPPETEEARRAAADCDETSEVTLKERDASTSKQDEGSLEVSAEEDASLEDLPEGGSSCPVRDELQQALGPMNPPPPTAVAGAQPTAETPTFDVRGSSLTATGTEDAGQEDIASRSRLGLCDEGAGALDHEVSLGTCADSAAAASESKTPRGDCAEDGSQPGSPAASPTTSSQRDSSDAAGAHDEDVGGNGGDLVPSADLHEVQGAPADAQAGLADRAGDTDTMEQHGGSVADLLWDRTDGLPPASHAANLSSTRDGDGVDGTSSDPEVGLVDLGGEAVGQHGHSIADGLADSTKGLSPLGVQIAQDDGDDAAARSGAPDGLPGEFSAADAPAEAQGGASSGEEPQAVDAVNTAGGEEAVASSTGDGGEQGGGSCCRLEDPPCCLQEGLASTEGSGEAASADGLAGAAGHASDAVAEIRPEETNLGVLASASAAGGGASGEQEAGGAAAAAGEASAGAAGAADGEKPEPQHLAGQSSSSAGLPKAKKVKSKLSSLFEQLDEDGSGALSKDELVYGLEKRRQLGGSYASEPAPEEEHSGLAPKKGDATAQQATGKATGLFEQIDADASGGINLLEWKKAMAAKKKAAKKKKDSKVTFGTDSA